METTTSIDKFTFSNYGVAGGLGWFLQDLNWILQSTYGSVGITMIREVRGVSLDGVATTDRVPTPHDRMLGYIVVNDYMLPTIDMVWKHIVADIAAWEVDSK